MKNQTCVDDRVVAAVQARDTTGCWEACPQPRNASTACYLDCLFTTILGNATLGRPGVPASILSSAFAAAFDAESDGGCPEVAPP